MSSINLEVPLIRTTKDSQDIPQMDGAPLDAVAQHVGMKKMPRADINFAEDADVLNYVRATLSPLVNWTRNDRQTLEEEWRSIIRMEWMVHDAGRRYLGPTNSYLPIAARINNTVVSSLSRGLFPSDEYMDVIDRANGSSDAAKATKTYLQWEFERVGQVRQKIKPFLRAFTMFGNAVLKYWYDKAPKLEGRAGKKTEMGIDMEPHFSSYSYCEGLRVSPRNLFHWYIYPYTADSVDDATLVFEDIATPLLVIQERVNTKQYLNGEKALTAPEPSTHSSTESVRMSSLLGLSPMQGSPVQSNELGGTRVLTECWTYMVLPKQAYMDWEDPSCPVSVKVVLAGSIPVEVRRNPFYHQRPPYLFARMNAQPAMIYGFGNGRLIRPLQYLINDFANQTSDVGQYSLNPIVIRNPSYFAGPLRPLAPGVIWDTTDIQQAVRFEHPDWELVQGGQEMMNMLISLAQDMGGTPPVLQGQKGDKTATTTQILQNNAMQPLQDTIEDLELDILVPLMRGTWMNAQQYRDKAVMAQIGNMPAPMQISPEQLVLDPEFRWMASSQASNQSQRAQQLLGYLQAASASAQFLQQNGVGFNPQPLLERVLVDGFGMRLPPNLFPPLAPPPMPGMPGGAPGGPPGGPPGMAPGQVAPQDPMSTVEQASSAPPANVQMAPGEGEAHGEVRQNANAQAAIMGGNNGKY